MAGSSYTYASGRVSGLDGSLLSRRIWQQLFTAENRDEVLRILGETWYGPLIQESGSIEGALRAAVSSAEEELSELSESCSFTDGILQRRDVRNARYLWKNLASEGSGDVDVEPQGTIPVETIRMAWSDPGAAESLPEGFRRALEELHELASPSAYRLDAVLDRLAASVEAENLSTLPEPVGDLPRVKIELRNFLTAARNRGDREAVENSLLSGGYHTPDDISQAARMNRLSELLQETSGFEDAAKALEEGLETGSFLSYQRESDLIVLEILERASSDMFSPGPLAAYVLGRELEASHLKMITAGKTAGIDIRRLKARVPRG